jgi:acyl-CoA thioesterase-1
MKTAFILSMMILMAPPQRPNVPPDSRPVILGFGDSLTAGYGVTRGTGYPEQLQKKLDSQGYKYRVVNMGISGDTTSGGRSRLKAALAVKPAIVILELGANDGLRGLPVKQMQANLEEMITSFQSVGATVVLAGMTLPRNYGASYVRPFEKVFEDLAAKHKLPLIPFFLQGVAGAPAYTLDDFLHPNAKGYSIVVETVLKTLEPLLKK